MNSKQRACKCNFWMTPGPTPYSLSLSMLSGKLIEELIDVLDGMGSFSWFLSHCESHGLKLELLKYLVFFFFKIFKNSLKIKIMNCLNSNTIVIDCDIEIFFKLML